MKVPFVKPSITQREIDASAEAVASGWLSAGPKVAEFAEAFADHLGVSKVLPTSSCTSALELALMQCVSRGVAVLMSPFSFVGVANIVTRLGGTPVLVDVDPATMNVDPASIASGVKRARGQGLFPAALVATHMYGHPMDTGALLKAVDSAATGTMWVVEDAAHAVGAARGGVPVGWSANRDERGPLACCFSFHAIKNLACGDGGALVMGPDWMEGVEPLVLHGMSKSTWSRYNAADDPRWWWYDVVNPGLKANMTDPAAAVGLVQLDRLPEMQRRRDDIADLYGQLLLEAYDRELLELPFVEPDTVHAWHLYVVKVKPTQEEGSAYRNWVMAEMRDRGVGTNVHFSPLWEFSAHRHQLAMDAETVVPVAYKAAPRLLSLPMYPDLTDEQVVYAAEQLLEVIDP